MVYALNYRRPAYVSPKDSITGEEKQRSIHDSIESGKSGMSHGIPEALSFDRIISGGTCPPCTLRDFMNYLKYIEFAAENLQFYLWFHDYVRRFDELPESEKVLSKEWAPSEKEIGITSIPKAKYHPKPLGSGAAAIFLGTGFAPQAPESEKYNPFDTPPRTPQGETNDERAFIKSSSGDSKAQNDKSPCYNQAGGAVENTELRWQTLTTQPFRKEILRIVSTYIADGAPRELNLTSKERLDLLHALQTTTHPSAFKDVIVSIEWSLRCQAHPNFIRWTICNGNPPRVFFARSLGIAGIIGGIVAGIAITLSSAGRAWRVLSFIGFFIGISTLIAAWKGMCVVLHGMHHRHLRPWELFTSAEDISDVALTNEFVKSFASSNGFESEPWVAIYDNRNVIRKIFDREIWIQEPALRQIQDTIFVQALLGALLLSGIATGILCAFPNGNLF